MLLRSSIFAFNWSFKLLSSSSISFLWAIQCSLSLSYAALSSSFCLIIWLISSACFCFSSSISRSRGALGSNRFFSFWNLSRSSFCSSLFLILSASFIISDMRRLLFCILSFVLCLFNSLWRRYLLKISLSKIWDLSKYK